ncbi:MAG: hypothetical protein R2856_05915 [Caldilineaceae bacterium]
MVHRRHPQAHQLATGYLCAHHQLLPSPRAWLRSARRHRLLGPQPLGCLPHPVSSQSPKAKRVEFRCPDPAANPYLAFSAMLMAGIDGIQNQIDPGLPSEMDLFEGETLKQVKTVKGSLTDVLDALEADHDYLTAGGVFSEELLETYIAQKRVADVDAVRLRPHPHEFVMYYGV